MKALKMLKLSDLNVLQAIQIFLKKGKLTREKEKTKSNKIEERKTFNQI